MIVILMLEKEIKLKRINLFVNLCFFSLINKNIFIIIKRSVKDLESNHLNLDIMILIIKMLWIYFDITQLYSFFI